MKAFAEEHHLPRRVLSGYVDHLGQLAGPWSERTIAAFESLARTATDQAASLEAFIPFERLNLALSDDEDIDALMEEMYQKYCRVEVEEPASSMDPSLSPQVGIPPDLQATSPLDHSDHQDNHFYLETKGKIDALCSREMRALDGDTGWLAASLVVAAREHGMKEINQVDFGDLPHAPVIWGTQRAISAREHALHCAALISDAVNVTMEHSAARWPQAMQQFQEHEARRQNDSLQPPEPAQKRLRS